MVVPVDSRALRWATLLVLLFTTGALASREALADTPPSRWDIAKDSGARTRYELHVRVRELLLLDRQIGRSMRTAALERARAILEDAHAGTSPDVRLRFDLGEVYFELGHHDRAIAVLGEALAQAPDHPAATEARISLAYAYAKLGRSKEERASYQAYLAKITDDRLRALAILNMAEAEMHLGDLEESIASYKEALEIATHLPNSASSSETAVLALWGLAVALDRSGDAAAAREQARLAGQMDPGELIIGHGVNVFFVPEYEREWYLALAEMAHARDAKKPEDVFVASSRALDHWTKYVDAAGDKDRWIALARAHQLRAAAAGRAARAKLPKPLPPAPPPPPPPRAAKPAAPRTPPAPTQ